MIKKRTFKAVAQDMVNLWFHGNQLGLCCILGLLRFDTSDPDAQSGPVTARELVQCFLESSNMAICSRMQELKDELKSMIDE